MCHAVVTRDPPNMDAYNNLVVKSEGKKPCGRPGIDGKIILEWILRKQDGKVWVEFFWLRIWTSDGVLRTW
jgi:hypothetical protein